jgi:hypothetical protein
MRVDSTCSLSSGDTEVTRLTPTRAPRVLNNPEVLPVKTTIANEGDSMVDSRDGTGRAA